MNLIKMIIKKGSILTLETSISVEVEHGGQESRHSAQSPRSTVRVDLDRHCWSSILENKQVLAYHFAPSYCIIEFFSILSHPRLVGSCTFGLIRVIFPTWHRNVECTWFSSWIREQDFELWFNPNCSDSSREVTVPGFFPEPIGLSWLSASDSACGREWGRSWGSKRK